LGNYVEANDQYKKRRAVNDKPKTMFEKAQEAAAAAEEKGVNKPLTNEGGLL